MMRSQDSGVRILSSDIGNRNQYFLTVHSFREISGTNLGKTERQQKEK